MIAVFHKIKQKKISDNIWFCSSTCSDIISWQIHSEWRWFAQTRLWKSELINHWTVHSSRSFQPSSPFLRLQFEFNPTFNKYPSTHTTQASASPISPSSPTHEGWKHRKIPARNILNKQIVQSCFPRALITEWKIDWTCIPTYMRGGGGGEPHRVQIRSPRGK